jgi:putative transposase
MGSGETLASQAGLLGTCYSSLFHKLAPPSERELRIKQRIDEVYTVHPNYGSRRITVVLQPELGVSRPTVQRYMREMRIFGLVPGPYISRPAVRSIRFSPIYCGR